MDVGTYVKRAKEVVNREVDFPSGYSIVWSGQFEYMEKARKTLNVIIPATLLVIFVLLFIHFHNIIEATIVMASLPFALVGGIWLLYILGITTFRWRWWWASSPWPGSPRKPAW